MITTKGQIIDINGTVEWLLFHRLTKKVNPVDFLALTDSIIKFPNFLFATSYLFMIFLPVELKTRFIVPASLYFCGQILINLRIGTYVLRLLSFPMLIYMKSEQLLILIIFAIGFFFLGWWNIVIIPAWLIAAGLAILILTSNQKKFYRSHYRKNVNNYQIVKNNAFLMAYKYYASIYKLPVSNSPDEEEIENKDWLKPYNFMRKHWTEMEEHFNRKAKLYWRMYLHIDT
jgi:mannose/fructose/N-acetylgalactosamine-specific phosphotransferase system component IIC